MSKNDVSVFSSIILFLAIIVLFFGLAICFYSSFHCIELDFTEEQRSICGKQAGVIAYTGALVIIGSVLCAVYRIGISEFVEKILGGGERK